MSQSIVNHHVGPVGWFSCDSCWDQEGLLSTICTSPRYLSQAAAAVIVQHSSKIGKKVEAAKGRAMLLLLLLNADMEAVASAIPSPMSPKPNLQLVWSSSLLANDWLRHQPLQTYWGKDSLKLNKTTQAISGLGKYQSNTFPRQRQATCFLATSPFVAL